MFFPAKTTNQIISIAVLVVVCSYCAVQVMGAVGGSFRTKIIHFQNDRGLTDSGHKCSPPPDNATLTNGSNMNVAKSLDASARESTVAQCRTYFRVCLSHYQAKINHSNCTFGSNFTPVYRFNSINSTTSNFETKIFFNFAWPGEYTLIIEAWNDMSGTQREIAQPNPRDELIYRHNQSYLNLIPSDGWWVNGSRSNELSLTFAIKVICEVDFYGENCNKFCNPRNDVYGHYYCNVTDGSKICMKGWRDPETYCRDAICKSCLHGECKSPNNCSCHDGWMGPSCDVCIPSETCDPIHGYCTDPGTCICKEGWGGTDCKGDLQYCTHNSDVCQNGGICLNSSPGNFTCSCAKGFTGRTCGEKVISSPCDHCTCFPTEDGCKCPSSCTTTTPTSTTTSTTTTTTTSPSTLREVIETTRSVTDLSTSAEGSYLSDGQKLTLIIIFGVVLPIIIMVVVVVAYIVCRTIRRSRQTAGNNNNNKDQQQHQQNNIQNTRIYNKNKNCEVVIRNDCSKNTKNLNLLTNSMAREKTVSKAAPPFPKPLPPASMPSQSGFDKFNKNLNRQNHTSLAFDNSYPSKEHYPQNFLPLRPYPRLDEGGTYHHHRPPYKSVVVSLEPGSPTKSPKRHDTTIPRHDCFPPVTMDFYYVSSLSSDDSSVFSVHSNEEKIEATVV